MTYVIVSKNLDVSVTKTIGMRKFCFLLAFLMLVFLAIGVGAGFSLSLLQNKNKAQQVQISEQEYQQKALAYQQVLIDHIGELSARLINLELETGSLAEKIGVVKEFEERMKLQKVVVGKKALTQPGSVGGPFIEVDKNGKQKVTKEKQAKISDKNNKKPSSKNEDVKEKSKNKSKSEQKPSKNNSNAKVDTQSNIDTLQLAEQVDIEPSSSLVNHDFAIKPSLSSVKYYSIANKINMADKINQTDIIRRLIAVEQNIGWLNSEHIGIEKYISNISLQHMYFPGRKPVINGRMTSRFGNRADPIIHGKIAFHSGIDFAAPIGTPVYASAGGKVIFAGSRTAYGNVVEIDHGAGIVTRYAHTSQVLVEKDQIVMPGDIIAKVGSTGRSTGAHLHFEILKDGKFVNPNVYLARF